MSKENLVVVHSFPTNSTLLSGLVRYLENHFSVYFVDLPGFKKGVSPLKKVKINRYSKFLKKRVYEYGLEEYIISGISFGFTVVNNASLSSGCKGVFAMEPFIGHRYLKIGKSKKLALRVMTGLVSKLGMSSSVWKSRWFRKRLIGRGEPVDRVDTMLEEMDPHTYFKTAHILLGYNKEVKLRNMPYVLMVNRNDDTIKIEKVVGFFKDRAEDLLVIDTDVEHYPDNPTEDYFRRNIKYEDIKKSLSFINSNKSSR